MHCGDVHINYLWVKPFKIHLNLVIPFYLGIFKNLTVFEFHKKVLTLDIILMLRLEPQTNHTNFKSKSILTSCISL